MADPNEPAKQHSQAPPLTLPDLVLSARDLFQGRREIWIEHEGVRYRLRITRRNKLILQK